MKMIPPRRKPGTWMGTLMMSTILLLTSATAETPGMEEMWAMIQAQQAEIERLRELVESGREGLEQAREEVAQAKERVEATEEVVEATVVAVEDLLGAGGGGGGGSWWERTSVGGYGELHWNFYEEAGDMVDFHRFVVFLNHEFNDWISLFSEVELEHSLSGDGKPGEVELEQAFIRMEWKDNFSTDAGLFIMPVGMLNEIHEPNTFYGVERNNIEARIIPTTWWEAGLKGNWRFDNGLSLDAGITSGLDMDSSGEIRSGRQKVAEAINDTPGYVARIRYTGIAGLELGASAYYQSDVAQADPADVEGLLTSAHIDFNRGGFRLRALYAGWELDGTDSADAESQWGYYIEPSYRWQVDDYFGAVGVYFRYSNYDYYSGGLKENEVYEIGVNYWPTGNVVFKADIQDISESDQWRSKGDKAVNLGVGYQF